MGRNVFLLQNLVNDNFESMGIFFGRLNGTSQSLTTGVVCV